MGWCDRVSSAADERNRLIHSAFVQQWINDTWEPVQMNLKSGKIHLLPLDQLNKLREQINDLFKSGDELERQLTPEVRPGVNYRILAREGEARLILRYTDGEWPNRPGDAELDVWWNGTWRTQIEARRTNLEAGSPDERTFVIEHSVYFRPATPE